MCGIRIKIWGDKQTGDKKYGGSILHVAKKVSELTFHCLMNEDEISNCWKGECFKIPIVSASKYPWDSILQVKCIEYFQTRTWEIKLNLKSNPVSGFLLQLSPPPLKWIRTATWELTMVKPRCRYCSAQLGPFVSESTFCGSQTASGSKLTSSIFQPCDLHISRIFILPMMMLISPLAIFSNMPPSSWPTVAAQQTLISHSLVYLFCIKIALLWRD